MVYFEPTLRERGMIEEIRKVYRELDPNHPVARDDDTDIYRAALFLLYGMVAKKPRGQG